MSYKMIPVAIAVLALALAAAPAARAQRGCQTIEVAGARFPRVELYDLRGNLVRNAERAELSGVNSALECEAVPAFLRIEINGERWLVRRAAMQPASAPIELPPCAPGQYASQAARNASSSGMGGVSCRPTE